VKKTVNQDDVSAYHLFYADGLASPGTDITFFDWPAPREQRGTRSIARTGMRVAAGSLEWWQQRFKDRGVVHRPVDTVDGRQGIDFEDFEGQRLRLVGEPAGAVLHPWAKSEVPSAHQIRGLGPIVLSVPDLKLTDAVLTHVMSMRRAREYRAVSTIAGTTLPGGDSVSVHVYEMGNGGPAAELHVAVEPGIQPGRQGAGGVHHVAFRTPTFDEYDAWAERLAKLGMPSSGRVDRFYFRSLYFREPNGILFEIATDEPGFAADEPMDALGERLALPPFLEPRRKAIEAGLKPLQTA
jgi:glyoxalase family protein